MARALEPIFVVLTLPGAVARSLLQRALDRLLLPSVDSLGGDASAIPYARLVLSRAIPALLLTLAAVAAFARSDATGVDGLGELAWAWLGVALAVHAWPSEGATAALYSRSLETDSSWRWIGLPLATLGRLFGRLAVVWLDFVYGLVLLAVVRVLV